MSQTAATFTVAGAAVALAVAAVAAATVAWARSRAARRALRAERRAAAARAEREAALRQVADEQAALRRVATAVAAGGGAGEVFDLVAEEAACLLGAEVGQVCRFAGTRAMVVGAWGRGALARDSWFSLYGSSVMAEVMGGDAARADDYGALSGHDPQGREVVHPSQFGAVAAPVDVDGELWGALLVVSSGTVTAFPPGAEERLSRFAELVSLAISGAEERDRLRGLATTDAMTGLANRRGFEARLAAEAERSARHGHHLALVLVDIDHFKRVNDTWGHQVGDEVLVEFARRLQAQARGSDLVGRLGGEEFAWLLPDTDAAGARDAADRARRLIARDPFPVAGPVTSSAGVCDSATAGHDPLELVRLADEALYAAKRAGRDTTAVSAGPGVAVPRA